MEVISKEKENQTEIQFQVTPKDFNAERGLIQITLPILKKFVADDLVDLLKDLEISVDVKELSPNIDSGAFVIEINVLSPDPVTNKFKHLVDRYYSADALAIQISHIRDSARTILLGQRPGFNVIFARSYCGKCEAWVDVYYRVCHGHLLLEPTIIDDEGEVQIACPTCKDPIYVDEARVNDVEALLRQVPTQINRINLW